MVKSRSGGSVAISLRRVCPAGVFQFSLGCQGLFSSLTCFLIFCPAQRINALLDQTIRHAFVGGKLARKANVARGERAGSFFFQKNARGDPRLSPFVIVTLLFHHADTLTRRI